MDTNTQTDKETNRQTDKETNTQTDKETNIQTTNRKFNNKRKITSMLTY